jgi:hypothetical protein
MYDMGNVEIIKTNNGFCEHSGFPIKYCDIFHGSFLLHKP